MTATSSRESYTLRHRPRPWVTHQKLVIVSFLGDLSIVLLSLVMAYAIRFETDLRGVGVQDPTVGLENYLGHVVFGTLLMMFLLANSRLHDPRHFLAVRKTFLIIFKSSALWGIGFLGASLALKIDPPISRIYCFVATTVMAAGLLGWRWVFYCILRREPFVSELRQKVVFVGWNGECEKAVRRFSDGRSHQLSVCGVVIPTRMDEFSAPSEFPVLGYFDGLRSIMRSTGADMVMVVDGSLERHEMMELVETCGREFVDFKLIPSCFQILVSQLSLESVHGMPVLGFGKMPLHHTCNHLLKRVIDVIGAAVGLAVFAPVMAVFSLLVYLESPGRVIYRQRRIGLNGKPFDILKIRSMKLNSEVDGKPGWTVENDPRRLRVGAFMRAWNIDELPQFWNVLKGEMSLVGPRPERPEFIEEFKEVIPHYNVRHNIKPGVTGWAQVNGCRGNTDLTERVKFDLDYIERWNFLFDFQIMLMTFYQRKGAC
ncbi:MAG: sugar transferase [Luteolibacter sp.]